MSEFFAGNDKLLLFKKQVDHATPITDFSDAQAMFITNWSKDPVRAIAPLSQSDKSVQQSANHVTAITPGFNFGTYGCPEYLDLIAEFLLGANDDSTTVDPTTHSAFPDQNGAYWGVLEVNPYGNTRYDGCRCVSGSFTATDTGQTELQATGLTFLASGILKGVAAPDPLPAAASELPFIFAEATVKYDGSSEGRTSAFTVNVTRNSNRAPGDNGFTALAIVHGKFQGDATATRYLADGDTERALDTGTTGGTVPTTAIYTQAFSVLFNRGSGGTQRQFLISLTEVAYVTNQIALDLNGAPLAEVLAFNNQPQDELADNMSIVTVNNKPTTEG